MSTLKSVSIPAEEDRTVGFLKMCQGNTLNCSTGCLMDMGFMVITHLVEMYPQTADECGGHIHELDGVKLYHYHLPDKFPWTIGCFTGCPEVSNNRNEFRDLSKNGC